MPTDYTETFTVNIEGSIVGTVGLEVVKASVTAKYGEGKQTSITYHLPRTPEKHQRVTVTWTWQEWTGDLFAGAGQGKFIARLPIEYKDVAEDLPCPVMDVSRAWLTPFNDLSYYVTQDQTQFKWLIRESGVSGAGEIEGKTLVSDISGHKVVYEVGEWDSEGNPLVLYTTHPNYFGVILFRTCSDFGKYLTDIGGFVSPQLKTVIYNTMKSLPNPTCPNVLQ